jgi:hypothetical protein
MTIQELINILSNVKDKSLEVFIDITNQNNGEPYGSGIERVSENGTRLYGSINE